MTDLPKILIFGRSALTNSLRQTASQAKRLSTANLGSLPGCLSVGQMLQLIALLRGRLDMPVEIRPLCEIRPTLRPAPVRSIFRDVDLALVEPASPIELSFRGFNLSWLALYQGLLGPLRSSTAQANQTVVRWLREGLLALDDEIRAASAAQLVELMGPEMERSALARAVVLETRAARSDLAAGLERMRVELARPMALIAASPSYRPDGRPVEAADGFADEVRMTAIRLGLPLFQPCDVISDYPGGAAKAFDPEFRRYQPGFEEVMVESLVSFCEEIIEANVGLPSTPVDLWPSGFCDENTFTHSEQRKVRSALARNGVRPLPFPFASGVAIASDVDASNRQRFAGYVGQLVDQLGLDFGDSIWLHWRYLRGRAQGNGFGFLSRNLTTGADEQAGIFTGTHTFAENIAQHHKGNVDHFHAFHGRGPRVAILESFGLAEEGRIVFEPHSFQEQGPWRCEDVCVLAVCVVAKPGRDVGVRAVSVVTSDGAVTDDYRAAGSQTSPGDHQIRIFRLARGADDARSTPSLAEVSRVIVELKSGARAGDVQRLLLTNTHGELVLERLAFLRDVYNVQMSLVTEHAAYHFRNPPRREYDDARLAEHVRGYSGPIEAYNGALHDDEGALVFSTDADHPASLCRVFPEISTEFELRFIVPTASNGDKGFDPLELVTPSPTRAGGGIYWARRVLTFPEEPTVDQPPDRFSRHSTFAVRLTKVLDGAAASPGLMWPLFTHLGGLRGSTNPDPYLDLGVMHELQDRAFNISGAAARSSRVWFTRATVIYDYALIMRGVGEHVSRPCFDTIEIESWTDEVLGKQLPRSPGQLYGLTFYVEDPSAAQVRLDGERLETLFRNPPDETGRASVTIAECDIRQVLFEVLDPLANHPDEASIEGGDWSWRQADGEDHAHGRLSIGAAPSGAGRGGLGEMASLSIPLHGWAAPGAQAISLWVRRPKGASFALMLETRSGARFRFGETPLVEVPPADALAGYVFDRRLLDGGKWVKLSAPFHDLTWRAGAAAGGPLPSHPLVSLIIECAGGKGAVVEVGGLEFLRPRCTAPKPGLDRRFCLGGSIPDFRGGEIVHVAARDGAGTAPRRAVVDQRGFFMFDRVAAGIHEVWATCGSSVVHDRRGALVEVVADTVSLILDRLGA